MVGLSIARRSRRSAFKYDCERPVQFITQAGRPLRYWPVTEVLETGDPTPATRLTKPRPTRLGRRRVFWGLLIALAWAAAAAALVLSSVAEARRGERQLQALERDLSVKSLFEDRTLNQLEESNATFRRAHRLASNPVTVPGRILPVIGRQLKSLSALTDSATSATSIAAETLKEARVLFEGADPSAADGRLRLLHELADLTSRAQIQLDDLDLGPPAALFTPLAEAREQIDASVGKAGDFLNRVNALSDGLAGFLEGPRRYLVAAANNAEMRAGSGMFLTWGLLETKDGEFTTSEFSLPDTLPPGLNVPMDPDIADRWGWTEPNREWRNLGLSPRFEANAEIAAHMWEASGRGAVDGMFAVDVRALRGLLDAVGAVEIEGEQITAQNAERILLHDQYVGVPSDSESQAARKERIGRIAVAAVKRLNEGHWDPMALLTKMAGVAQGRHLLAWSRRADEQAGWHAARLDGGLGPNSLLVAVNNRGGNKLDQFLDVTAELAFEKKAEGTEVTLSLEMENTVTPKEPSYVLGADPPRGPGRGVYSGILAVNIPGYAVDARIAQDPPLAVAGPDGPTLVIGQAVEIPPGRSMTAVVEFFLPAGAREILIEPSARIPRIRWRVGDLAWKDDLRRPIEVS